ncbi:xanthine dehydrogenase small subunit [Paraneptunicella aestuarii]|uniref:xanthine dehydrogenase small subunit n=1 Tax=Paraneptunicella aestuarii TaxID=2831148 RepID=UPI001E3E7AFB|nr:xanthine dehydrogenase small subunit [Paraneptunicella aestuarii]UAA37129.1 xanthine dehydrogenase small subunit [Paraneptunicella aestuarii]
MISFLLNDKPVHLNEAPPNQTVLEFLRENRSMTGTKEGCASGDCGACTTVLAEYNTVNDSLEYKTINSCITFLPALHGKQLITVEYLSNNKELHPVQEAMVKHHGSQCGFCTPGFVMSIFAQYQQQQPVDRTDIEHALSGNLCRCTGYRPIIDAALDACNHYQEDKFAKLAQGTIAKLKALQNQDSRPGTDRLFLPANREELAATIKQHPTAKLVAGATDLALESTQLYKDFSGLIYLGNVTELNVIEQNNDALTIGAAVNYQKFLPVLLQHYPELEELFVRLGSLPIRNQGTMGGNVANASPIGDTPPVLLALNASINLDDGTQRRSVPARNFFHGYRQTDLKATEWIESISIPKRHPDDVIRAYKVSKRYEDDISTVCAVFKIRTQHGYIHSISSGFGGVAAVPSEAKKLSFALVGLDWKEASTHDKGRNCLATSFSPITDVRASNDYRQKLIVNLWKRFWLETSQADNKIATRVITHA